MKTPIPFFALLTLAPLMSSGQGQTTPGAAGTPLRPGTLLQTDFENGSGWLKTAPSAVGTIDIAGSTTPSKGLRAPWMISSGPLALKNTETNLGKLTLAFMLSASAARPVCVRVESFDKNKKRTGGLETIIYPAAPDFYQRYALDLNTFRAYGAGKFAPIAPFHSITVALRATEWKSVAKPELRLDNVQFAEPAYYVSKKGNDSNDGRTEKTAFATPQKAVDMAGPGDIIDVMNGTYLPGGVQEGVVRFKKPGAPSGWISLKNYPGHQPIFSIAHTWEGIRLRLTKEEAADATPDPVLAYIEVRGLHIRGEGDVAKTKYAGLVGKAAPETNGNAIGVSWDVPSGQPLPHHIRFADNVIEYCPGGGLGPGCADWAYIENNTIRNNCWTTIYANSGISLSCRYNFDGTSGGYRILVRNNITSGNRTFVAWGRIGRVSDGNGIIVDVSQNPKVPEEQRYNGRILICNNLSFNNGGSGIHAFKSAHVDVVNNTVYMNSASPELDWGQMFVNQSHDVRFFNNIVVAPLDQPLNTDSAKGDDKGSTNIVRANNLYFGGGTAPLMGQGDQIADPMFVNPSIDEKVADFHLKTGSPALGVGRVLPITPLTDLTGKRRAAKPTLGAYEK